MCVQIFIVVQRVINLPIPNAVKKPRVSSLYPTTVSNIRFEHILCVRFKTVLVTVIFRSRFFFSDAVHRLARERGLFCTKSIDHNILTVKRPAFCTHERHWFVIIIIIIINGRNSAAEPCRDHSSHAVTGDWRWYRDERKIVFVCCLRVALIGITPTHSTFYYEYYSNELKYYGRIDQNKIPNTHDYTQKWTIKIDDKWWIHVTPTCR